MSKGKRLHVVQPDETLIGYARVSTEEQTLDLQIEALAAAGVPASAIYSEKVSGAEAQRPQLARAMKHARPGDTFVCWKLDRIARSLKNLLEIVEKLEKRGVGFRCITQTIDTTTPAGRLMMAMLGAFAEFERDLITERTRAGVRRAQAQGVRFGRKPVLTDKIRDEFERRIASGESVKHAAASFGIAITTFRNQYKFAQLEALRRKRKIKSVRKKKGRP